MKFLKWFSKWNLINLAFMIVIFYFGFYVIGGVNVLGNDAGQKTAPLANWIFILFYAIFALATIGFIFVNARWNNYRPKMVFVYIGIILFAINTIALLSYQGTHFFDVRLHDGGTSSFSFALDDYQKILYIFEYLAVIIIAFLILDVVPKVFDFNIFYIFAIVCSIVVLVCVVASFFMEGHIYIDLFSHLGKEDVYEYTATSFFAYRNSYGFVIFLGIVSCLFLHQTNYKWYWLAGALFFFIAMFFTLCKTALILSVVLTLGYLIARFVLTFKENKKRNIIAASIGTVTVTLAIAAFFVLKINISDETLKLRFMIWQNSVDLLNKFNWFDGVGFHLFGDILFLYNTSDPYSYHKNDTQFAHNGFLELLGNGGFVLLAVFFAILIYVVYRYAKEYKNNKTLSLFEFILVGVSLLYMMVESGTFILSFTLDYSYIFILTCSPALMLLNKKSQPIEASSN